MKENQVSLFVQCHSIVGQLDRLTANLSLATACQPTQAEAREWLGAAQEALGCVRLSSMGLTLQSQRRWLHGAPMRGPTLRLVWHAWSLTHCPSNLLDLQTWITWGRMNPAMPADYRQQAIRLLRRKSGPTAAVLAGRPPPKFGVKPWARSLALKRAYVTPGCGLPFLG